MLSDITGSMFFGMPLRQLEDDLCRCSLLFDERGPYIDMRDMYDRVCEHWGEDIGFEENVNGELVQYPYNTAREDLYSIGEGFIRAGFKGKRIAVSIHNSYRYIMMYSAISCGVGVFIPVERDLPEPMYEKFLGLCDAQVLVCSSSILEKAEAVKSRLPGLETIIVFDKKVDGYLYLEDIIEDGRAHISEEQFKNLDVDVNAPSVMLFTSGTTGANKCVMLSQKNLMTNLINNAYIVRKFEPSMSVLPMTHGMEINCHVLARVCVGRKVCICGSIKDFIPMMNFYKPSMFSGVPMMLQLILKGIWDGARKAGREEQLKAAVAKSNELIKQGIDRREEMFKECVKPFGGNLKAAVVGGAPMNPDLLQGCFELGIDLINGYGITECGPLVSMNDDPFGHPGSAGHIVRNTEARIDDPDENGVGELLIKNDCVMVGYYKDEEATKAVMTEDGFFRTGDYARFDEDGYLYIVGRKKNLIILPNGKNVYPEELEDGVRDNIKFVRDAVVYSAVCNVRGEKKEMICCAVNFHDGVEVSDDAVRAAFQEVNRKMPAYKKINYVLVHDREFEKTPVRKVIRKPVIDRHDPDYGLLV